MTTKTVTIRLTAEAYSRLAIEAEENMETTTGYATGVLLNHVRALPALLDEDDDL